MEYIIYSINSLNIIFVLLLNFSQKKNLITQLDLIDEKFGKFNVTKSHDSSALILILFIQMGMNTRIGANTAHTGIRIGIVLGHIVQHLLVFVATSQTLVGSQQILFYLIEWHVIKIADNLLIFFMLFVGGDG